MVNTNKIRALILVVSTAGAADLSQNREGERSYFCLPPIQNRVHLQCVSLKHNLARCAEGSPLEMAEELSKDLQMSFWIELGMMNNGKPRLDFYPTCKGRQCQLNVVVNDPALEPLTVCGQGPLKIDRGFDSQLNINH